LRYNPEDQHGQLYCCKVHTKRHGHSISILMYRLFKLINYQPLACHDKWFIYKLINGKYAILSLNICTDCDGQDAKT
jgi:hypothetical protein